MKLYKSILWFTAGALASLSIASCKSNSTIVDPKADTQALYRDADTAATDTTNIADIPWKEYFTDAKLQVLIEEGIKNNYDMQIAQMRIQQAEASLMMARAALFPTLSAGVQTSQTRMSSDPTGAGGTKVLGYNSPSSVNQVGFVASWEIDVWGKLRNQKKAKQFAYMNTLEYKTLIQTNVVTSIASAYFTLLALDEQLNVSNKTIELLTSSSESIEQMKEAGMQTAAAVESSKALLYSTQLSIPALQSQIKKQENAICALLGRNPGAIDRTDIASQTVPAALAIGVPAQLLSRRPDVRQAELSFRQSYSLTRAAKAGLYPSFTISSASLGFTGDFSNMFSPKYIAGSLIGSVMQPIFYKKQLRGNLLIAKSQQEESLLVFKSTVLRAGQEVSSILDNFQASLSKNELRAKQVVALDNSVTYTQELLAAGEANYVEVLTAQNSLLSAQLSQVNDKLEQLSYTVSLYKALGGGR